MVSSVEAFSSVGVSNFETSIRPTSVNMSIRSMSGPESFLW